jgi:hypothetical protein
MWQDFLHSFVPAAATWHGRIRTMQHCAPILADIAKRSPLPLVPVHTWILPAQAGWQFVEQNQLGWAIDTGVEDEIIRREFLRHPLPEPVRAELRTFLLNRLPGLLLVDAVFKGEDMGLSPYPHLFPRKYVIDPNSSLVERLRVLEQNIKELMSMVFFAETRKCLSGILLPLENWMVSISVAEVGTTRRGSFYYPDMTAVVWSGGGGAPRGLLVPGWWEPMHPHFPTPATFTPGGPIGPGPANLLGLETKMGLERMQLIPRHLAKTHGTMNLTTVSEEHEVTGSNGTSSRSSTALVAGESSPLSDLAAELIGTLTAELEIPLGLQLLVQPDVATGKSCAALLSVRPYTPSTLRRPIRPPITGLLEKVLDGCPSRGEGSAFARYVLLLEQAPEAGTLSGLTQTLRALEGMGESALILSREPLPDALWEQVQSRAVVAVCAPGGEDRELRPELLHFSCDLSAVRLDHLAPSLSPLHFSDGLPWHVVPKPLRMTVEDGVGAAWL